MRDPRKNPIYGDVLQSCRQLRRVEFVTVSDLVIYSMNGSAKRCKLDTWRRWASNTRVVARGDKYTAFAAIDWRFAAYRKLLAKAFNMHPTDDGIRNALILLGINYMEQSGWLALTKLAKACNDAPSP